MKIFLSFILISVTAWSWSHHIDQRDQSNTSRQVIAVHPIELKKDMDPIVFEQYVNTEIAPICNKIEGLQFMLVKGDRGSRINKYAIILTFATIEDRNRVYPYGEESREDWGPNEIWERFASMASGLGDESSFVDYVEIPN